MHLISKYVQRVVVISTFFLPVVSYGDTTQFSKPTFAPAPLSTVTNADTSDQGVINYDTGTNELVRKDGLRIPISPLGGSGGGGGGGESINGNWPIDTAIFTGGTWVGGENEGDWNWVYNGCTFSSPPDQCVWKQNDGAYECDGYYEWVRILYAVKNYVVDDGSGRKVGLDKKTCVSKSTSGRRQYGRWPMIYSKNEPNIITKTGQNIGTYKVNGTFGCSQYSFKPSVSVMNLNCAW